MRPRHVLAFSISLIFILAAPVLAQTAGEAKAKVSKSVSVQPVFTQAGDLKWTDLDPKGAPGVKIADLWGDHTKGAFGAYLKLPAGFAVPSHAHERYEGRVHIGHLHPGARRKTGSAARSGVLHDAARRELPAHDLLRQGLGLCVICRQQRQVRPQAGGDGKGTCEVTGYGQHGAGSRAGADEAGGVGRAPGVRPMTGSSSGAVPRPTATSGRLPAVTRGAVLDHARVGAHRVAGQILRAGVPVVLAVFERGIVDLDDRVLIAGIVLTPAGKLRQIVVAQDDDVDAVGRRNLIGHRHAFQRLNHHRHEHVVVDRRAIVQARRVPDLADTHRRRHSGVRTVDTGRTGPHRALRAHRRPWER